MSYDTIERIIFDAVRDKSATAPSRTAHFYKRTRHSTPFRELSSDSSDVEGGGDSKTDTHGPDSTDLGEVGDSSSFGVALITAALKPGPKGDSHQHSSPETSAKQNEEKTLETDPSSQDIGLSEVREQVLDTTSKRKSKTKNPVRPKRQQQRGVPMREELFAKIGWTRSFISGLRTRSTIRTRIGVMCVRRISRLWPRAPSGFFGSIAVKNVWDVTSGGGTNTSGVLTQWLAKYSTELEAETGNY